MHPFRRPALAAFALTASLLAAAELKVAPLEAELPPTSGFVPVRLDACANALEEAALGSDAVLANAIPFELVRKPGVNHVFLKEANWADWAKDPSSYYSPYDTFPTSRTPNRVIFTIPAADYAAVHLLASAEDDTNLSPIVSFRIGALGGGHGQVLYHDFQATIPRVSDKPGSVPFITTPRGKLFLVRVPLEKAIAQDFINRKSLSVEVTKELRLAVRRPDPCRYQIRPLGLPSGVRIFGMTFQYAPVQMAVTTRQSGHIFNEPETPQFQVSLTRLLPGGKAFTLEAEARDRYGNVFTNAVEATPPAAGTLALDLRLPVSTRGCFDAVFTLKSGRNVVLARRTSFAVLPPDTRKYRAESPFGVWDFTGAHYTPADPDFLGPLYVKAGLRYGMFNVAEEHRARYGLLKGNDLKLDPAQIEALAGAMKTNSAIKQPDRLMIFHETSISGPQITRTPDFFTGRGPYVFNEKEQATFSNLWAAAEATAKAIRTHLPGTEIYFGNGAPLLLEEFLRRKFPAEWLGSRGNEAGTFMRMPEQQPPDFIANNAGLFMDRALLDGYGYADTPLRQCYEMCYPNTNPGNLSPDTQARYLVRHLMHSLAWRIPIIRSSLIVDTGNSYYFSNWGASGLCYAMPDVRPKPSYVAMATLTLLLDGATFTRMVPTGSPVVYAFEFRKKDNSHVVCLWTLRGAREVGIPGISGSTLTDLMGTESTLKMDRFTLSADPVFLTVAKPLGQLTLGPALMETRPAGKPFAVSPLARLADWTVETGNSLELETYNPLEPRRKGDFLFTETAAFEGEPNVLAVRAKTPVAGKEFLPMYSVLKHNAPADIPGQPTRIGLMVNGNGGWGRVIFELTDASGQRWISIGAEERGEPTRWLADMLPPEEFQNLKSSNRSDWNTNDAWQRSCINFEGWRYLSFPLPGNYPGEGYHWPYSSQWRYSGDGIVRYPIRLTRLILTIPEKVLTGTVYAAVPRPEIYLKDLMVTYDPPEVAFTAE
jgi:hypothetical protein